MPQSEPARLYTSAHDRRTQILDLVEQQGYCTIMELSKAFDVSDMTVRRDVQRLVVEGQLRSVHGGVTVLGQNAMSGTDFRARSVRMHDAKKTIAARALDFLPLSGAVALDAGTTTLELARTVPQDARIHVVTPSLSVINALAGHDRVEVMCPGGNLHRKTESFAGPTTVSAIGELRVRTLFLAASGITGNGVYCGNDYDAVTKRALMDVADEVILLADSSKFSLSALVRVCSLDDVDRIVTDDGINEVHLRALRQNDIDVVLVPAAHLTTPMEEST